jgi:hypothetical protein
MTGLNPSQLLTAGMWLALVLALVLLGLELLRRRRSRPAVLVDQFAPILHLRTAESDMHVLPRSIAFPGSGKLRIGYHPAFMDGHVGNPEFGRLPAVDVRGDQSSARELSRHAACIWRDPETGSCFVQLGWPGPGEPIRPRTQSRVLRLGRPHDAASQPFRLAHGDVLRLSSRVEYVFLEIEALRDRPTPEQKKIEAFETSAATAPSSRAKLSLLQQPTARPRPLVTADDDDA